MKPVELHHEATTESEESVIYYNSQQHGLGYDFEDAVEQAIIDIRRTPQIYPVYLGNCRMCSVETYPFVIYYEEFDDLIYIYAIYHTSREPDTWLNRKRED